MFRNSRKIVFVWAVCFVVLLASAFPVEAQNHLEPLAKKKAKPVTAVTASPPLVSSGGTTPNISLPGGIISAVTVSPPLVSSGGTKPNISLPGVIIENSLSGSNTAMGDSALTSNLSNDNTAIGANALQFNTTGENNTASGFSALVSNTNGDNNTAIGVGALPSNTTGGGNTAVGFEALLRNTTGNGNTALGNGADVSAGNLTNATAIGSNASVDVSNKIRLGNTLVTVIEGQVDFTFSSDATKKEKFRPVDGEEVLRKIQGFSLTSWNFIGHDPKQFRHYGPMAQDFFAAFGRDEIGTIGTPTTINSGDMAGILMIAVQALEKQSVELKKENGELRARLETLERLVKDRPYRTASTEPIQ